MLHTVKDNDYGSSTTGNIHTVRYPLYRFFRIAHRHTHTHTPIDMCHQYSDCGLLLAGQYMRAHTQLCITDRSKEGCVASPFKAPKHSHLVICCNTLDRMKKYHLHWLVARVIYRVRFIWRPPSSFRFNSFCSCVCVLCEGPLHSSWSLWLCYIYTCASFILPIINCFPHSSCRSSWLMLLSVQTFPRTIGTISLCLSSHHSRFRFVRFTLLSYHSWIGII